MPLKKPVPLLLTIDLVILTVRENALHVLVVERGNEPYLGQTALPGGFVREGEDLLETAQRELTEETSLDSAAVHLEQLAIYGAPDRDPRGRVVSVAYLALAPDLPVPEGGTDARHARWSPVEEAHGKLAFDHTQILDDAVERARRELEFTTLATSFCAPTFTISELRAVYEVVWGIKLDASNFIRKVTSIKGFILPTGDKRTSDIGRPAALYRRGPARDLNPPLMRSTR